MSFFSGRSTNCAFPLANCGAQGLAAIVIRTAPPGLCQSGQATDRKYFRLCARTCMLEWRSSNLDEKPLVYIPPERPPSAEQDPNATHAFFSVPKSKGKPKFASAP